MNPTFQHKVIAEHLQKAYGHLHNWPFSSADEIEDELSRKNLALTVGDYLVVSMRRDGVRCGKASDLEGLVAFSADSLVVAYHELERAFHDQYADHVEL